MCDDLGPYCSPFNEPNSLSKSAFDNCERWFSILKLKWTINPLASRYSKVNRSWHKIGRNRYVYNVSMEKYLGLEGASRCYDYSFPGSLEDSSFTLLKSEWCVQHCDTLNGRSWREIGCQKIKACHLRDQPTSHHHSADEFSRYYWLDDHHNSLAEFC